jgi:hypothetical protein
VTAPRRPARPLPLVAAAMAVASLIVACNPRTTPGPAGSATPIPTATPSLTAVPGGPASPVVGPSVGPPTTTDVTGFGRIYDSLPPSFPKLPGQEPADTGDGPTSGSFAANMDPASAAKSIEAGLAAQGWTVDAGSPLEDGSVVVEATGPAPGCRAEVRLTPAFGTVIMSVLYGASCPFA